MEPRQRPRQTGAFFNPTDIATILYAYGDEINPLPETIRVLDSIIVDFILELCYEADARAAHAPRVKVKGDDIQFAVRHKETMLGQNQHLVDHSQHMAAQRQMMDLGDGKVTKKNLAEQEKEERERKAEEQKMKRKGEGREDFEAVVDREGMSDDGRSVTSRKSGVSRKSAKSAKSKRGGSVRSASGVKRGAGEAGFD